MKLIPLIRVSNISQAIDFYTTVLDFELKYPGEEINVFCTDLVSGEAELQLSEMDGIFGVAVTVRVEHIDSLFEKYINRGLVTPKKKNSPVHEGPLNQTWGTREFYITDADGNTLRFAEPIRTE